MNFCFAVSCACQPDHPHHSNVSLAGASGISLIRAGAKNFNDVVIVPSKAEYGVLLDILNRKGAQTDLEDRKMFATRAFGVSSHYDTAIHDWFSK